MKKLILLIAVLPLLALSACSNTPPPPPEPEGDKINVNPPIVFLIDLYQKEFNPEEQSEDK